MTAAATRAPLPDAGPDAAEAWVAEHLGHVSAEGADGIRASPAFRGGQAAADAALAALDVRGYARARSQVWPEQRRGASRMSPYVRHGLLALPAVWDAVAGAPPEDRRKYRDELLWQEYARHLYARVGTGLARPLRHEPAVPDALPAREPWDPDMACMDLVTRELETDGWLVNQTRMWAASQWTVRGGRDWREGEDALYRHLLDGSRAANRLGWQWTVGAATGRPYGFSRWQVRKRAPGLCETCLLRRRCPVEEWPEPATGPRVPGPAGLRGGDSPGAGPVHVAAAPGPAAGPDAGPGAAPAAGPVPDAAPDAVWLTFESLGDADPALAAHPGLPVVAVFDEPLLARLRLSGKRLVFLAETLAELGTARDLEVHVGDPVEVLAGRRVAVTWAPVPGFARRAAAVAPVELHPWPWLVRPGRGPLTSFSAWRAHARR